MRRPLYSICPRCEGIGLAPNGGRCPAGCVVRHVVDSGLSEAQAEVLVKRRQDAEMEAMTLRARIRELEAARVAP